MSCTYHRTGPHFECQPIWECDDCQLRDGEAFCAGCRTSCHARCKSTRQIQTARAYCDCGARGVDKCAGMRRAIEEAAESATATAAATAASSAAASASAAAASNAASVVAASSSPASPVAANHEDNAATSAAAKDTAVAAESDVASGSAAASTKAASAGRPKSTHLQASAHQRHHSAAAATTRRVRAAGTAPTPAAAAPPSPHAAAAAALLRGSLYSLSTGGGGFGSHAPSPPPFTSAPPSECTFLRTGTRFTAQPLYACFTCGMSDDLAVCYFCVLRCHTHHQVAFVSESARAYCDCGSRCAPKATTPTAAQSKGMGLHSLFGAMAAPTSPLAASTASSSSSSSAAAAPRVIPPCQALTPLPSAEARALAYLCTLVQTGKRFHKQKLFHCRDCNISGDEVCCQPCAELCHRGHSIEEREAARAYCDCSANGLCQTLDIASVVRARSAYSSHTHTPSFSHLSRRGSLTDGPKTPQLELTILSQSTPGSKLPSAANSRRSSLGAQTRRSLLDALEPPPPEDKAPVPPPMPRAQSAHTLTLPTQPSLPLPEPTSPASAPPAVTVPAAAPASPTAGES